MGLTPPQWRLTTLRLAGLVPAGSNRLRHKLKEKLQWLLSRKSLVSSPVSPLSQW